MKKKENERGCVWFKPAFKMLLAMKLIFLLVCGLGLLTSVAEKSYAQSTKLTINLKNTTIKDVLEHIENNSEFSFMYENNLFNMDAKVDFAANNESIDVILSRLFDNNIEYRVIGRHIVLYATGQESGEILQMQDKQQTISGTVTDEAGQPLPGATVVVKGTTHGTVTDVDGNYTLTNIPKDATLQFSFVGMTSQSITVGTQTTIDVTLVADAIGIEEVVAIGYGTQIRKNLSSAISSVRPQALENTPLPSVEQAMQGRIAGVQVATDGPQGGAGINIRIRGTTSFQASNEPLYVIDGIPMETGQVTDVNTSGGTKTNILAGINPNDIESMEILKDAAAAAIYGSRGGNGVVLITTKSGKSGKTNISASASYGISDLTHKIGLLNSEEWIMLAQEAWYNSGNNINDFWGRSGVLIDGLSKEKALATNVDWIDQVLRLGNHQEFNLSASGGSEKTIFYVSGNYKNDKSIFKTNDYQRMILRSNLEHQISNIFRIGSKMSISYTDDKKAPAIWSGGLGKAVQMLPLWPIYKEDGTFFYPTNNPVASIKETDIELKNYQFIGNWFAKANITTGLNFRTELGTSMLFNDDFNYKNGIINWNGESTSLTRTGQRVTWNWKNILNYTTNINGHSIDALAVIETQQQNYKSNTITGEGFLNSTLKKPADAAIVNGTYIESGFGFMSYIGRLNYSFKDKYLISLNFRADGSSRFGKDNRWGYFPAASIGYTISEENYFETLKSTINFLKLRASYGVTGNAEIGDYVAYSSYYTTRYGGEVGVLPESIADNNLGWERTTQLNLGLSAELLDGRIGIEFDYYDKQTDDLLMLIPVSQLTGVASVTTNVGQVENKGFEIAFNTVNVQSDNFKWETGFTFSRNRNELTQLDREDLTVAYGWLGSASFQLGEPIQIQRAVRWGGIDPQTGEYTYYTKDGTLMRYDQIIDFYGSWNAFWDENNVYGWSGLPEFTGGITSNMEYKNWYMDLLFNYEYGAYRHLSMDRIYMNPFGSLSNTKKEMLTRWRQPGDETTIPKLTTDPIRWGAHNESMYQVDYFRLKQFTLGHRFSFENSNFIQSMNCYFKGINLLTFTNAPDIFWDPEYDMGLGSHMRNPQATMYMVGVTMNF